jgi:hypothetical protein
MAAHDAVITAKHSPSHRSSKQLMTDHQTSDARPDMGCVVQIRNMQTIYPTDTLALLTSTSAMSQRRSLSSSGFIDVGRSCGGVAAQSCRCSMDDGDWEINSIRLVFRLVPRAF